jgi:DNA-binding transcriptional LysR family regulator
MRIDQAEAVVAVAREGGFAAATASIGLSQPTVSRRVAALEREVVEVLFRRRGGTRPTAVGKALLARLDAVVNAAGAARRLLPRTIPVPPPFALPPARAVSRTRPPSCHYEYRTDRPEERT